MLNLKSSLKFFSGFKLDLPKNLLRSGFLIAFAVFFLVFVILPRSAFTATCLPGECGSWYTCQYNTYCCNTTLRYCPSWYCINHGWCWYGSEVGCYDNKVGGVCPSSPSGTEKDVSAYECYECGDTSTGGGCTEDAPAATTLISPTNGAVLYNQGTVTFSWTAVTDWGDDCDDDKDLKEYKLYLKKGADAYVLIKTTTGTSYTNTMPEENATYSWYVQTDNGPKTANSATFTFTNYMFMNLTVRVSEADYLTNTCPAPSIRPLAGVTVRIFVRRSDSEIPFKYSVVTGTDGAVTVPVRYSTTSPAMMDICTNYSEGMCQTFVLKCRESVLIPPEQTCTAVPQLTNTVAQTVNLQLSKVKKDAWVAITDSDGLAANYATLGPCTTEQVLGGFYGAFLNINKLPDNSNIYALSLLDQIFPSDITEGSGGGFAKNIGSVDTVKEDLLLKAPDTAVYRSSLNGFIKPGVYKTTAAAFTTGTINYFFVPSGCIYMSYLPHVCAPDDFACFDPSNPPSYCKTSCYTVSTMCTPTDSCYYPGAPGDCSTGCVHYPGCGSYDMTYVGDHAPRIAVIYVDGTPADEIVISDPIRAFSLPDANTAPGNLVIITRAKIRVTGDLSTPLATYNVNSPSQINAVLISSTGITVDSEYLPASPDEPIIFDGALISTKAGTPTNKSLKLLRDLGINNNTYPATVVRYPLNLLKQINEFIKMYSGVGLDTGLEVFDIEFDYSPISEEGIQ